MNRTPAEPAGRRSDQPGWTPRLIVQRRSEGYFGSHWETRGWVVAIAVTLTVAGVVVSMSWAVLWAAQKSCANTAEVLGIDYRWRVIGGCFLEVDGRFVPKDNYRINEDASGDRTDI